MTSRLLSLSVILSLAACGPTAPSQPQQPVAPAASDTAASSNAKPKPTIDTVFAEIQRSHIDGNVPDPKDFDRFLRRDLERYFASKEGQPGQTVTYELLRDGPTQSGVSFPKFYLWVRLGAGAGPSERGAVRVAAIDRREFKVTDFIAEEEMRSRPHEIDKVFPPAVCDRIRERLEL